MHGDLAEEHHLPVVVKLEDRDQEMLAGEQGDATALAMRIVVAMAEAGGAQRLIDITGAHIDGCLYHGPVGLRFAERLAADGAQVRVPTTLNVSALDLLHPERVRLAEPARSEARRQMVAYESMGCRPTWTCAPYQLPHRPAFGEHVCWAESNAIVFANSVLGARTDRYGDFMDICAAITGRVPEAGLHVDANRLGTVEFRLSGFSERATEEEAFWALLGHVVGARTGNDVPVIDGAPGSVSEDHLKALGAAAASSGSVALVHVVGTTPEAATLRDALGGRPPARTIEIGPERPAGRSRRAVRRPGRRRRRCRGHPASGEHRHAAPVAGRIRAPYADARGDTHPPRRDLLCLHRTGRPA